MDHDGGGVRPDARLVTEDIARLRRATRSLRVHLDTLPIDYDLRLPGDRFLAGLAFMSARQRYDCADSLIGAGFGGIVLGSIARSLFVDGLRWLWIGEQPARRRTLLGELLEERNGICIRMEETHASCPILPRWLMPLPDIANLTGQSMILLDAPPMPSEDSLLGGFLSGPARVPSAVGRSHAVLLTRARSLFDMAGLRGAVMVLAHAGHGNHLGQQSTLTRDGAPGHDLRADHEAIFMQVAAAGATATLLGVTAAVPELWPADVQQPEFLQSAIDLAGEVTANAVAVHRLTSPRRPAKSPSGEQAAPRRETLLRPGAVMNAKDLLPDVNSAGQVIAVAEEYYAVVHSIGFNPWEYGEPALHAMLDFGAAHSNLQTVMSTYDQPGSAIISVFAARMLLEAAARLDWRNSVPDEDAFKGRAKQFFDEYRSREMKTINLLVASGVPRGDAAAIFERPGNVQMMTPGHAIAKGRTPLPSMTSMLRDMGRSYPEPGWLVVAYSLLSQITHNTPIGLLHTIRFRDADLHGNELSPEMLGLSIDIACLGSARLLGHWAVVLTNGSRTAAHYRRQLLAKAATVHNVARLVHGLD